MTIDITNPRLIAMVRVKGVSYDTANKLYNLPTDRLIAEIAKAKAMCATMPEDKQMAIKAVVEAATIDLAAR